tara:strand:- start:2916 stop:4154 length:1239 start_codon:yes stop_codon:yes gene_type:complete
VRKDYKKIKECRICGCTDLVTYLDLDNLPLVNRLLDKSQIAYEKKYPLNILFCQDCNLSQLSIVVDPEILYKNYVYRSSMADSFKKHCSNLADELNKDMLRDGELIIDIASNDGCLLRPFKDRNNRVLGIDPATNLAGIATKTGIETISEFWDQNLAKKVLHSYGKAKVITAFNVFAHIHDVHSFLEAVMTLLDDDGCFIIEVPYLYNLIEKTEFDTVYHEHLSYFLIKPLDRLIRQHGLILAKVKEFDIHGGSIRLYVGKKNSSNASDGTTQEILEKEKRVGLHDVGPYISLRRQVKGLKNNMVAILKELKSFGKSISGFGASAKGNVLLNYSNIGLDLIDCIFDDTPEKQGKIYPGVHIPIVSRDMLSKINPDYLLLLSWNFADEMMRKTRDFKEKGGKYIIPVPYLRIK